MKHTVKNAIEKNNGAIDEINILANCALFTQIDNPNKHSVK